MTHPHFRPAPCGLYADASEHVAEVVVDRVQVLRRRIHGTHLDDESGPDDVVAERPFRRVGPVPGNPKMFQRLPPAMTKVRAGSNSVSNSIQSATVSGRRLT